MKCRNEIRELVVWSAGTELDAAERRRVEQHVADCSECRELMALAHDLGRAAREATHPDAETLVQWVEDSSALSSGARAHVEEHVDACPTCAVETTILTQVDAGTDPDAASAPTACLSATRRPGRRVDHPARSGSDEVAFGDRLRRWFGSGMGNLIPAAAVLGVAIVTAAVVSRGPERSRDGFVTGPTLLSDTRATVRGGTAVTPTIIEAGTSPLLLLELTDLTAPPADDAVFRVELVAIESPAGAPPIWQREILGNEFADTYALAVQLPAEVLQPGEYQLRLLAADQQTMFEAAVTVR